MIRSLPYLLSALVASAFISNAQTTRIEAPKLGQAAPAFAGEGSGWDAGPVVSFSPDGRYIMAWTQREAKAWRMPEGELVYSMNTSMLKDDKTKGVFNYQLTGIQLTADGKYIYGSEGTAATFVHMPADVETGELLQNGLVKDSLKNGTYQLRRGVRSPAEISYPIMEKLRGPSSILKTPRKTYCDDDEGVGIYAVVPSPDYPGEIIFCHSQTFCPGKSYMRERLSDYGKDFRKWQEGTHKKLFDLHVSRYNPATGRVVYVGNFIKGAGSVDFDDAQLSITPSPVDDVVCISGFTAKTPLFITLYETRVPFCSINTYDGKVLWQPSATIKGAFEFKGFNEYGVAIFRTLDDDKVTSEVAFDGLTGKVLNTYVFSEPVPKRYVYNAQWNVTVGINKLGEKGWSIGVYSGSTGERMLSLTDLRGSTEITAKRGAEMDRINAYQAAARKAMQNSWDRQAAENARYAQEAQMKKYADDAAHKAASKPCPLCSGTGVWVNSGVAKAYRRTSYSEGRALDGSRTTIKSTESSTGGYWEQRSACLKCHGRGEVAR